MKLNAGIVTHKLQESKDFYTKYLDFNIKYESDFYILLETKNKKFEISFLLPNHPTQADIFQEEFKGKGLYLTIEYDNIKKEYDRLKNTDVKIYSDLKTEDWGDTHFSVIDPNGVGIDLLEYKQS